MLIARIMYKKSRPNPYICLGKEKLVNPKKDVHQWLVNGFITNSIINWIDDNTTILDVAARALEN